MGKRSRSGEGKEGKDWGEPGPRGGRGRLWRRRAPSLWRRRSTSWTPCRWRSVGRGVEGEGHLPLLPQGLLWITVWKLVLPFAKVWSYEFGLGLSHDGLLFEALSNLFYIWGCCLLESWLVTEPLPISALQSRLCARTSCWKVQMRRKNGIWIQYMDKWNVARLANNVPGYNLMFGKNLMLVIEVLKWQ